MDHVDPRADPVRLLLVDDDPLVRQALALMLGGQDDLVVVGEAEHGRAALARVRDLSPDLVLMDIRMPVMDGLEATRELHAGPRPPRVIVLTTFDADEYVVAAVAAGADGFLLKDTAPADLISAVRRVAAGEPMMSPSATATLIRRVRAEAASEVPAAEAAVRLDRLTGREHEVAVAVARGLSNAEIAGALFLSVPTVKAHVSRLFEKLEATNRVQIAMIVHDAGLV